MEWPLILLLIFGGLVVLMATGMPIALAFILVNLVAVYIFWGGETGFRLYFGSMVSSVQNWAVVAVPCFILLGSVLFFSGVVTHAMDVIDIWLGRLPGRLGLLAVGAGTLFATLTGSSMGSCAMLSATLVPEMERRGYKKPMSLGPILGAGGLAIMIPPSGSMVFQAFLAQVSVGKLLMAGIIPGLLMGVLYAFYVLTRCYLQPSIAPPYKVPPISLAKKLTFTIVHLVPVGIIIFLVTGVIILGIATPSEASACGALGAFLIAAAYRKLSWKVVKDSFVATIRITVMLLAILLGAMAFSQVLGFSGVTRGLIEWVTFLPVSPITVIIGMLIIVLILGCLMDLMAIAMMVIPLYMPLIYALGFDPIWFLILLAISIEMGLTTPPFGMLLFVMKGAAPSDTTMGDIYKAGLPFLGCDALAIILVMLFPEMALWLPSMMITG